MPDGLSFLTILTFIFPTELELKILNQTPFRGYTPLIRHPRFKLHYSMVDFTPPEKLPLVKERAELMLHGFPVDVVSDSASPASGRCFAALWGEL